MIEAIFYARFLSQEGVRVIYQNPSGSIVPDEDAPNTTPLFDFEAVSEYVIPRQAFYNRLVTVNEPNENYLILGFPVCIKSASYERNEFMFNFGLVLSDDLELSEVLKYEVIVKRLAGYFTELEVQSHYLSKEAGPQTRNSRSIKALLEIIKEDLNNYSECMIPVDDSNTINLKLFPIYDDPPPVKLHHVPVFQIRLDRPPDDWDLTAKRIIPFVDGINDVRRIAQLSDTSAELTKIAVAHFLMYGSATCVDKFFFANVYAIQPVPFEHFVRDVDGVQEECARYVAPVQQQQQQQHRNQQQQQSQQQQQDQQRQKPPPPPLQQQRASGALLCQLYARMQWGQSVKDLIRWSVEAAADGDDGGSDMLRLVDARRLVQFGVVKGFLQRVHRFPVSARYVGALHAGKTLSLRRRRVPRSVANNAAATANATATTAGGGGAEEEGDGGSASAAASARKAEEDAAAELLRYVDGCHSMDQIIVETGMVESEIVKRLALLGKMISDAPWEIQMLHR